jgi:hypothetical protein
MPHVKIYIGTLINAGSVYIIENNAKVTIVYKQILGGISKGDLQQLKIANKTSSDKIIRWAQNGTSNTEHIYSSLGAVLDDICEDE